MRSFFHSISSGFIPPGGGRCHLMVRMGKKKSPVHSFHNEMGQDCQLLRYHPIWRIAPALSAYHHTRRPDNGCGPRRSLLPDCPGSFRPRESIPGPRACRAHTIRSSLRGPLGKVLLSLAGFSGLLFHDSTAGGARQASFFTKGPAVTPVFLASPPAYPQPLNFPWVSCWRL